MHGNKGGQSVGRLWRGPLALRQAVERRQDFPMWGGPSSDRSCASKAAVSDATVGRIIADLAARCDFEPVRTLRRRPYARRWTAKRRFARRLLRDLVVSEPGGLG